MRIFAGICLGLLLSAAVPAQAEMLRVSGRVSAVQGGQGLAGIEIYARRNGEQTLIATTGASGDYSAAADVPAGIYRISAQSPATQFYIGKIYPNVSFPGFYDPGTSGTVSFKVPQAQPASGIDFALELGGRLTVAITASATGQPLADAKFFTPDGNAGSAHTGANGLIAVPPVAVGSYTGRVIAPNGYISENYDNLQCPLANPSCGTPTPFTITAGSTTAISFALERGVSIRGYLRGPQGEPVAGSVGVYRRNGQAGGIAYGTAGDDGYYETNDTLPPGQYALIAASRDGNYSGAVYPDVTCSVCDINSGAAVTITNQSVNDKNFTLQPAGTIRGKLELPEEGFSYLPQLFSAATHQEVSGDFRDSSGSYRFGGLQPGSYYVTMRPGPDPAYVGELYKHISCSNNEPCDFARGTPITVTAGGIADNIDLRIVTDLIFGNGLETP